MQLRSHTFRVQADVRDGEVVGVTGDAPQLGEWKVGTNHTTVLLAKDTGAGESNLWTGTTWLPQSVDVHYRYYVAVVVEDHVIINQREVSLIPRVIKKDVLSNEEAARGSWHVFGVTGGSGPQVDRGWLTHETVIHFKLHSGPIQFWKPKVPRRKLVKVTPVIVVKKSSLSDVGDLLENSLSLDTQESNASSDIWPLTEFADLNDPDCSLRQQPQFGYPVSAEDSLLFQVQVVHPDEVAYMVDVFAEGRNEDDPPDHLGVAHILPSVIKGSEGHIVVPISSLRHRPIGQLSLYYVKILPIADYQCDMSVSYSRHWKHNSPGLDVAHRGLGNSFVQKSCAEVRENTIASLKEAASHGADFVEFDVQLSKDLVPVIYHDFHVCISLKRKHVNETHMLQLPVKELTLNQLQGLKLYHVQEGKSNKPLFFDDELEEHQPFPTLEHAFQVIDPNVGFNIEIKWTMALEDGTFELENPYDLNKYLDAVLKVVLEHGGNRKIVFSCFHPDICTMVKYKQAKYPVVFLTMGVTSKYPTRYMDPCCHTIPSAVRFARCLGMLGINVHTEDILRDPAQVALAKQNGLVMFCWGDDNNDPETIVYLKKLGLNAIIYDKIDQFGPKRKAANTLYLSEGKENQKELLQLQAASDNQSALNQSAADQSTASSSSSQSGPTSANGSPARTNPIPF